ncbi:MAG: lanthionine synthetase C family protein [Hyalangium sp.]|uniref:lanthionine synthetase C family protein n=1 Tax=Hyalangium sp. TaxID=2028555 RepID=UPI003899EAA1
MSSPWKPLLTGRLQSQALEAAEAIIKDVASQPLGREPGLLSGYAGYALFFEMAARTVAPDLIEQAALSLQRSAALFARNPKPPRSLHGGLSGLGWAAARLAQRYPDLDVAELFDSVDEALGEELNRTPWPHPCDIRDGLAGMGLYAAERVSHPRGRQLLERAVAMTEEAAERSEAGVTWSMPRGYWVLHGPNASFPQGLYTTGVAHGIPGALCMLALAHALGVSREKTQPLLEEGFRWMASRAQPGHPQFPHYFHGTEPVTDERFSWCVGNPGITAALWWAARAWGDPGWQARTLEWATHVAREGVDRKPHNNSANLCCGTAGTAQIFLRLFQATGQPVFAEAATRWVEHTLALRQPGNGPGGYCFEQDPARPLGNVQFGATGIALMLLAAATDQVPDWDQPFLFSLEPTLPATPEA